MNSLSDPVAQLGVGIGSSLTSAMEIGESELANPVMLRRVPFLNYFTILLIEPSHEATHRIGDRDINYSIYRTRLR